MIDPEMDSGSDSEWEARYPGLPIPVSSLRRHILRCRQPNCFAAQLGSGDRHSLRLLADSGRGTVAAAAAEDGDGVRGPHWLQLSMPRTRSVVYHPEEEAHEGHLADRESVLVTHASLRLVCSCPRPACCLPSLLNRLCEIFNRCHFDHGVSYHRGHLSTERLTRYLDEPDMPSTRARLVASGIKALGLVLAMLISGLVGYLAGSCPPSPPANLSITASGGGPGGVNTLPLSFTLDTGSLSGLEVVLLCAVLALTVGALACLFRSPVSRWLENWLLVSGGGDVNPPLLARGRRENQEDDVVVGDDEPPADAVHVLRPPSPLHWRLN